MKNFKFFASLNFMVCLTQSAHSSSITDDELKKAFNIPQSMILSQEQRTNLSLQMSSRSSAYETTAVSQTPFSHVGQPQAKAPTYNIVSSTAKVSDAELKRKYGLPADMILSGEQRKNLLGGASSSESVENVSLPKQSSGSNHIYPSNKQSTSQSWSIPTKMGVAEVIENGKRVRLGSSFVGGKLHLANGNFNGVRINGVLNLTPNMSQEQATAALRSVGLIN